MKTNETTYWVTLATMPKMRTIRKNALYVACFKHQPQYSIADFFENSEIRKEIGVTQEEEELFENAHNQLVNNAFLVEDLQNQGYEILPITHQNYPKSLKINLKMGAPCVVYIKGNKDLLNQNATAIVGSRKANQISLDFTTNIARKAVRENKVVVSGFAKGVDRQALDATLEFGGKSIIVLPQGITTFRSGFKQYYQPIIQGRVVVLSTFHPKAPWSVELAMARNSIIYGFASEIYAAQSDASGGTWSGVMEGIRKGSTVYVRISNKEEENANNLLIQNGAIGVDFHGNIVVQQREGIPGRSLREMEFETPQEEIKLSLTKELVPNKNEDTLTQEDIKVRILDMLNGCRKMSKDIVAALGIEYSDAKMKKLLRSFPEIEEARISGKIFFFKKGYKENNLFEETVAS